PIVKDHAFFFFSYQGQRTKEPQAESTPTVFTPAERGGDFSAAYAGTFSANPIPFAMYSDNSPGAPCPVSGGVQCQPGGSTNYTYAQLFPSGVIPTQDFNPLSLKLLNQFVPSPNVGQTYQFNSTELLRDDQYLYRIDDKLRQNDSIWFYGLYETQPTQEGIPFVGSTLPGFAETDARHYQQYSVSWSHTFSPTTLNEARFAYLRFNFKAVEPLNPINPTTYGFTGIIPQTTAGASIPVIN